MPAETITRSVTGKGRRRSREPLAEHFVFKGGTSLSKGWGLIERLSEDNDIALAPAAFEMEADEFLIDATEKENLLRSGSSLLPWAEGVRTEGGRI